MKFLIKDLFNLIYWLRFGFCLLLFFGVRIGFNYYNFEKEEILIHHFYKEKIISVKKKNQLVFWLKENKNEEKIIDFVINSYLVSRRLSDFEINYYPEDSESFVYGGKQYKLK